MLSFDRSEGGGVTRAPHWFVVRPPQFYRRAARDVLSMEKPRSASTRSASSSTSGCNLGDMIATKVPTPERSSLGFTMKSKVSELLMTLSTREQEVSGRNFHAA